MSFRKYLHGQALVESIVGFSFVIVPIMLLFPFLSKMTGIQHRAQEAAHYTAWERTVWKESRPSRFPSRSGLYIAQQTEPEVAKSIPWRFYQKNGHKISSDITTDWSWNDNVHPLLKHQVFQGERSNTIVASTQDEPVNHDEYDRFSRESRGGRLPGSIAGAVGQAVGFLSFTGFSLERDQFYRTQVTTNLEKHYMAPFNELDLSFSNNSAILASGWNAGGPMHVNDRVKRLVLTNYMDNGVIQTAQSLIGLIPFAKEIRPSSLRLGHVDANALPDNRLCTYGTESCGG
ncbi:hypothetical protein [Shewanella donghaensis]|uniref:hypothetical protein n=1 Tax=Shewanella donghaensis TaxID=238836 RepID=UPI001181DC2A|nr:hypothetical protein [Shewanella donghaensis]